MQRSSTSQRRLRFQQTPAPRNLATREQNSSIPRSVKTARAWQCARMVNEAAAKGSGTNGAEESVESVGDHQRFPIRPDSIDYYAGRWQRERRLCAAWFRLDPRGRRGVTAWRRENGTRSAFRCFPTVSGRPKQAWHIASLAPRGSSSNATGVLFYLAFYLRLAARLVSPLLLFPSSSTLPSPTEAESAPRFFNSFPSPSPSNDLEAWPTRFSHQPATWPRDWNACLVETGSSSDGSRIFHSLDTFESFIYRVTFATSKICY